MRWTELAVIAVALSLDASAVAMAAAAAGHVTGRRAAFRLWFHFGLFQFLMPVAGWAVGTTFQASIAAADHWIAFGLLGAVGGRMVWSAIRPGAGPRGADPSRGATLVMLAVATSIDALAVGLSLAMLGVVIWIPSTVIGLVTAGMTVVAIGFGSRLGGWLGRRAQLVGGVVLILIGARILVSHLSG